MSKVNATIHTTQIFGMFFFLLELYFIDTQTGITFVRVTLGEWIYDLTAENGWWHHLTGSNELEHQF